MHAETADAIYPSTVVMNFDNSELRTIFMIINFVKKEHNFQQRNPFR